MIYSIGAGNVTASPTVPQPTASYVCDCTQTCCGHYPQSYRIVSDPVPLDPGLPRVVKPWIQDAPVVGHFKNLRLPAWRPRQQRARDGI